MPLSIRRVGRAHKRKRLLNLFAIFKKRFVDQVDELEAQLRYACILHLQSPVLDPVRVPLGAQAAGSFVELGDGRFFVMRPRGDQILGPVGRQPDLSPERAVSW